MTDMVAVPTNKQQVHTVARFGKVRCSAGLVCLLLRIYECLSWEKRVGTPNFQLQKLRAYDVCQNSSFDGIVRSLGGSEWLAPSLLLQWLNRVQKQLALRVRTNLAGICIIVRIILQMVPSLSFSDSCCCMRTLPGVNIHPMPWQKKSHKLIACLPRLGWLSRLDH